MLEAEASLLALLLLRRRKTVEAALKLGRNPSESLYAALRDTITLGRTNARALGLKRFNDQLGLLLSPSHDHLLLDRYRASQIAGRQTEAILKRVAKSEATTTGAKWTEALKLEESRVKSTATTETFSAASAERDAAAQSTKLYQLEVLRVWDARLDKMTCFTCFNLDGTIVGLNEQFPGGYYPGSVHVRCRCWYSVIRGVERDGAITFSGR